MNKNILATICLLFGLTLLLPITASAAYNDVTFSENTDLYLSGIPLTLVVGAGSEVEAFTVYPTYVSLDLCSGSAITITSADKKTLIADPPVALTVCDTNSSSVTIGATFTRTVTVTPGSTCVSTTEAGGTSAVSGGSGGGGGAAASTVSMPTSTTGKVTTTSAGGGKTTVTTAENTKATVRIPAYTVSASTETAITPVAKTATTIATSVAAVPTGQNVVGGYVYNYSAASGEVAVTTFSKPVTLTMTYTDAQVAGLKESSLAINYWSEVVSKWIPLKTTVSKNTNTLTATTTHFTYFAILGEVGVDKNQRLSSH